jgi:hypothetical protein
MQVANGERGRPPSAVLLDGRVVGERLIGVLPDGLNLRVKLADAVRCSFSTLSQAEEENGQSRIYLGIHWAFDKTEGIAHGRLVGDHVFENAFQPLRRDRR